MFQAAADPDRVKYDRLAEIVLRPDASDAEVDEFERLQAEHPDWEPRYTVAASRVGPPDIPRQVAVFTPEEIARIAASQRCSVAALKNRWIIQRGGSYYIIGLEGEYRPPISRGELLVSMPRDLCRVPSATPGSGMDGTIEWDKSVRETSVLKSTDEFLADYATVARKVVASMAISHSYYDPESECFWERVCPLRKDIAPAYSPDIDAWLRLLGGETCEKLLDWVAVSSRLDKPICAVYLHGAKDAGKTMFAAGLARLWGEAPTELESAHASFNSALTDNPLVFADEEIPRDITSGFLRKFVGQGTHPLRRKNVPEAKLLGHFRLVIAANEPDLLKFDNEDFTPESVDAIAGRVLYIKSSPAAAEYLRSLGGRAGTEGWVDGDKIAAHALWLAENRVVTPGSRFLVEGAVTDMHRRIATHGSIRGLVIEWIAKAILKTSWGAAGGLKSVGVLFGGGKVYVNTAFVKDTWEEILGDNRVPSLSKIGRALKPLAIPDERGRIERRLPLGPGNRADFYNINPEHVYDASRSLQVGTVERFRGLIEARRAYVDLVGDEPVPPLPTSGLFALPPIPSIPPIPERATADRENA